MNDSDPYEVLDDVIVPWARRHGIRVGTIYQDCPVRSVWFFDKAGERRAQLWLDVPDHDLRVTVHVAALDAASITKWTAHHQRKVGRGKLGAVLDEFRQLAVDWIGLDGFTG